MENKVIDTTIEQTVKPTERFVMKVVKDNDEFILNYPPTASYQDAFNATLQLLLKIYDMSKQVGETKDGQ